MLFYFIRTKKIGRILMLISCWNLTSAQKVFNWLCLKEPNWLDNGSDNSLDFLKVSNGSFKMKNGNFFKVNRFPTFTQLAEAKLKRGHSHQATPISRDCWLLFLERLGTCFGTLRGKWFNLNDRLVKNENKTIFERIILKFFGF